MLIFNTTYLVSDDVHESWLEWVREQHIPFMLDSTYFSHPQVARVITSAKQDGTSFSVQFHIQDMHTLKLWNKEYNSLFQENCSKQFGTEVIFFTTVLELVE
jgi:L-rhamnose isomerase